MKNTLTDLNNHLFAELERLSDEELSEEEVAKEVKRANAITNVAKVIVENGNLALRTMKHMDEFGYNSGKEKSVPVMLETKKENG